MKTINFLNLFIQEPAFFKKIKKHSILIEDKKLNIFMTSNFYKKFIEFILLNNIIIIKTDKPIPTEITEHFKITKKTTMNDYFNFFNINYDKKIQTKICFITTTDDITEEHDPTYLIKLI